MSELPPEYEGLDGAGVRVGVVVSRFNEPITASLLAGARGGLAACGVAPGDVAVTWVPGAFELPLLAKRFAESGRVDAVICLGAVVRGDTPHFEYVAQHAAAGIGQVALHTGVPVIFGVLTTDTIEQAVERSGEGGSNKGYQAALAAVDTVRALREVGTC